MVGHVLDGGFVEVGGFVEEDEELVHEVVAELPGGEAAAAPVGDVLVVYGVAFEMQFEQFLHCRDGVEPLEDGARGVGAFEAEVEFLADGGRQF